MKKPTTKYFLVLAAIIALLMPVPGKAGGRLPFKTNGSDNKVGLNGIFYGAIGKAGYGKAMLLTERSKPPVAGISAPNWGNEATGKTLAQAKQALTVKTGSFIRTSGSNCTAPVAPLVDVSGATSFCPGGSATLTGPTPVVTLTSPTVSTVGGGTQGFADGALGSNNFNSPNGMAVDAAGNIYVSDQNNNRIRKISTAGIVSTLAGNSSQGLINGTGSGAYLRGPAGIAVDASGNVYVADQLNHAIRKISPSGVTTTLAGNGSSGSTNGTGSNARFFYPYDVEVDASGNVYVADQSNGLIRKITPGGTVTTLCNTISNPNSLVLNSAGNLYVTAGSTLYLVNTSTGAASIFADGLSGAIGVDVDASGNVYVVSNGLGGVSKITASGTVSTLVSSVFNNPTFLAVSGSTVYVGEYNNGRVSKIALPAVPSAIVSTFAGSSQGFQDATGTSAKFNNLNGIARDASGNLYVSDFSGQRIRKITSAGVVSTLAGNGNTALNNGTGTGASFNSPSGLDVDASGNVYVADQLNHVIRKITPAGVVSTFAGSGGQGSANGSGSAASFSFPFDVAVDAAGNVFVADYGNGMVRKITAGGLTSTLISGLSSPAGVAIDASGNIYVAEQGQSRVNKYTSSGSLTSVLATLLSHIDGVEVDAAGNVYTVELFTGYIKKISTSGTVSVYAGNGTAADVDGLATSASFYSPTYMVIDPTSGDMYVCEFDGNKVRKIAAAASGADFDSYLWSTGETTQSITVSTSGNYTLQTISGTCTSAASSPVAITLVNVSTPTITASGPTTVCAGTLVTLTSSALTGNVWSSGETTRSITTGNPGTYTVYTSSNGCNSLNSSPVTITTTQMPATPVAYSAGPTTVCGGSGSVSIDAAFSEQSYSSTLLASGPNYTGGSLAIDASDNIYICDYSANKVWKISPGGTATVFAGTGASGANNGAAGSATFFNPSGIAIDAQGNLFVADRGNHLIRKITSAGVVSTFAGSTQGYQDGTGTAAKFYNPTGIATDASGNVYVGDVNNYRIRKITSTGVVSTLAGSGNYGNNDGQGTLASFRGIAGLAVDASGNLYVTDFSAQNLRKITPSGLVTTLASSGAVGAVTTLNNSVNITVPGAICITPSGAIYFSGQYGIYKTTPQGIVTNVGFLTGTYMGSVNALGINSAGKLIAANGNGIYTATLNFPVGNFLWSNGATTETINVTTSGTYSVRMVNGLCTTASSQGVTVNIGASPTASITAGGSTALCTGGSVSLTASGGTSYLWSTGATTASITAGTAGSYTVQAITAGCTSAASSPTVVTLNTKPTATITAGGATTFCNGGSVTLTANGGTSYLWSTGATTSSISPATSGSYTVQAISNGCTSNASAATVVTVTTPPVPTITAGGALTFCTGGSVTLTASGGTSYRWSTGATTASITVSTSGSYTVQNIASGCTSVSSAATVVTVNTTPTATITAGGATSFCTGGSVTLTASGGNSYLWSNGASTTSITATASGTYTVTAISNGCSATSNAVSVVVGNLASAPVVTAAGSTTICPGSSVTLSTPDNSTPTVSAYAGANAGYSDGNLLSAQFLSLSGIAFDASGNMYIADAGNNRIRKITTAGVVSTLAGNGSASFVNGTGTAATFNNPLALDLDAAGNIYVVDAYNNAIRKITPGGVVSTLAGGTFGSNNGTGTAAQFNSPYDLAVDAAGNVYVTDQGNGQIRKITSAGVVSTLASGLFQPFGIVTNGLGVLYVTTGDNSVTTVNANTGATSVFIGNLGWPNGIALDAQGNIYVAETLNKVISKLSPSAVKTTFAAGPFQELLGMAVDAQGALYFAGNSVIKKVTPPSADGYIWSSGQTGASITASTAGTYTVRSYSSGCTTGASNAITVSLAAGASVPTISASGSTVLCGGATVTLTSSGTNNIWSTGQTTQSITVSAAGDYSVSAIAGSCTSAASNVTTVSLGAAAAGPTIQAIGSTNLCPGGSVQLSFAGSDVNAVLSRLAGGTAGYAEGAISVAKLGQPAGIAVDASGNVYFSDYINHRIRVISNGVVSTYAGTGSTGKVNGSRLSATFTNPAGLCFDASGNLIVADQGNHLIRKITTAGVVSTYAGTTQGFADDFSNFAKFNNPRFVAADAFGNVYVTESGSNRVREILGVNGYVYTVAGGAGAGSADGIGTAASFNQPCGMACNANGEVFVADYGNNRIRKIGGAQVVTTITGNSTAGGVADGQGMDANLRNPYGLTIDANNNIYILQNQVSTTLRRINASGYVSTIASTYDQVQYTALAPGALDVSAGVAIAKDANGNLYVADVAGGAGKVSVYTITFPFDSYLWSTGETTSSITAGSTGAYTLQTVKAGCASFPSTAINVTLNNPVATITPSGPTNICNGSYVILNASGGDSYLWSTGETTASIQANSNNDYTVQAITGGCTSIASAPVTVTVSTIPAPVLSAGGPTGFCLGGTVTLTATGGTQYKWSNGKTGSSITVDSLGDYYVQNIASGCTSARSNTITVQVSQLSQPTISPTGPTSFCPGGSVRLEGPISGGTNSYSGTGTSGFTNGNISVATWNGPRAMVFDKQGNLYVADYYNSAIRKISSLGQVSTFATFPGQVVPDIAIDNAGNIIACAGSGVYKITPAGVSTLFAGGTSGKADGLGTAAKFSDIQGVGTDASGNIYTSEGGNNLVRKISPSGLVTTLFGGFGAAAVVLGPGHIVADASGAIYIIDNGGNNRIAKYYNGQLSTLAGAVYPNSSGYVDGPGANARFNGPIASVMDASGNIYVADAGNNMIRKISPSGNVTTVLDGSSFMGSACGVALDAAGNLYVSDRTKNRIWRSVPGGVPGTTFSDYLWSTGETTQAITASTPGTYTLRTINAGCTSVASLPVTVTYISQPVATVTASGPTSLCAGGSVTLTASGGTSYLWSNGATSSSITVSSGTSAGTDYTVQAIIGSCTSVASTPVNVVVNSTPNVSVSASGATSFCSGGSVTLTASGGQTYKWSNGATTAAITVTASGSFTVQAIAGVCTSTVSAATTVTVTQSPTATITPSGPTTFCAGSNTTLVGSGGSKYIWTINGNTTTLSSSASIVPTVTGTYYLKAIANNCTSATASIAINVNPLPNPPTVTAGSSGTTCAGTPVILTASGAPTGGTYLWSNGQTGSSISVGSSGSYSAQVIANGCTSASGTAVPVTVLAIPTTPVLATIGGATVCSGGTVTLSASPALATGQVYLWSNGATLLGNTTNSEYTVSASGNYTVKIADGNCVSASSNVLVVNTDSKPATPTITASGATTFCAGGSVTLTGTGGLAYIWNTGQTTESIIATQAGPYFVQSIANGCTSDVSAFVQVSIGTPPVPAISPSGTISACLGSPQVLTATGGTNYLWSTGETTASISVSTAGTYTVQSISGTCTTVASAATTVGFISKPVASVTAGGPTTFCEGGNVVLTATGGDLYTWSNGQTGNSITVSTGGDYFAYATVGNCTSDPSAAITVTVNPLPSVPVITGSPVNGTNCSPLAVSLSAGTAAGYLWSNGATTSTISVTASGNYTVRTLSASGCTSAISATYPVTILPRPSAPVLGASGSATVCSGTVTLTVSPAPTTGQTVLWFKGNGAQVAATNNASYTATASDTYFAQFYQNGCASPISNKVAVSIGVPAPGILASATTIVCPGGTVTLTATGGSQYLWSTGETTASITVGIGGPYTVKAISGGCQSASSSGVTIINGIPLPPTITTSVDPTICTGESVVLTALGGSQYIWSTGETSPSITVNQNANITVRAISATCTTASSATTVVNVIAKPVAGITASGSTALCAGGQVTLTGTGGTNYLWSTGDTSKSIIVNSAGSVTVQAITGSCTSAVSSAVNVSVTATPDIPFITALGPTTICTGASVTLNGPSGSLPVDAYLWSNGATTQNITVSDPANYSLRVISNGCTSAASAPIVVASVTPTPVITVVGGSNTLCYGNTATLIATGGSQYIWSNGAKTNQINFSAAGTYTVSVQAIAGGCTSAATAPVTVTIAAPVVATLLPNTDKLTICKGTSVTLTAGGGTGYVWSNGIQNANSISVNQAGYYYVTARVGNCSAQSKTIQVELVNTPDQPVVSNTGTTICTGASTTLGGPSASGVMVSTLAGSGNAASVNGNGTAASFNFVNGVDVALNGSIYVSDYRGNTIRRIGTNNDVTTFSGSGLDGTVDGSATTARFSLPSSIVVPPTGTTFYVASYDGTIRSVSGNGSVTTIYNGNTNGRTLYGGMTWDPLSSSLYVVNKTDKSVIRVTTNGDRFIRYTGFVDPWGIATDGSGNFFVSERSGQIYKLSQFGTKTLYASGLPFPYALAYKNGIIYAADYSNHNIYKVAANGTISVLAGTGTAGSTDGNATVASFNNPSSLAFDAFGNLIVGEAYGNRVRKITLDPTASSAFTSYLWNTGATTQSINVSTAGTYTLRTISGTCTSVASLPTVVVAGDTPPVINRLNGNVAVPANRADTSVCEGTLVTLKATGAYRYLWSTGDTTAQIVTGGQGVYTVQAISAGCTSASSNPITVTVKAKPIVGAFSIGSPVFCAGGSTTLIAAPSDVSSATQYLWSNGATTKTITITNASVAGDDYSVTIIQNGCTSAVSNVVTVKLSAPAAAPVITSVANLSAPINLCTNTGYTFKGPEKAGSVAKFLANITPATVPPVITVAPSGNIYTVSRDGKYIQRTTPSGLTSVVETRFLSSVSTYISCVAVDQNENIYVADQSAHQIYSVPFNTGFATRYAGSVGGYLNSSNNLGARFNGIGGMVADASGNLYVSDTYNNRIRKIAATGGVTTFAGNGQAQYQDGNGTQASFLSLAKMTIDPSGNLYVIDQYTLRKITPARDVTTIDMQVDAGDGPMSISPADISCDGNGKLFFADVPDNLIGRIDLSAIGTADVVITSPISSLTDAPLAATADGIIYLVDNDNAQLLKIEPVTPFDKYLWSNGDTTQAIDVFADGTTGSHTYTLRTITGTCTSLASSPVVVNFIATPSVPVLVAGGTTDLCTGGSVTLAATGGNGSYIWNTGATTASITVSTAGVYSAYSVNAFCQSEYSDQVLVNIYPSPEQPTINAGGPTTFCPGGSVTLTASAANTAPYVSTFRAGKVQLMDMMLGKDGNYYAISSDSNAIVKITPTGAWSRVVSGADRWATAVNGNLSTAVFGFMTAFTQDAAGNFYVADQTNNSIRKIGTNGVVSTFVSNIAQFGTAFSSNAGKATFRDLIFDKTGNLYLINGEDNVISKFDANGNRTDINLGNLYAYDNNSLVVDQNNNLYVSVGYKGGIIKISPSGAQSVFVGGSSAIHTDGQGTLGSLAYADAMAIDNNDNIYVTEGYDGGGISKVTSNGTVSRLVQPTQNVNDKTVNGILASATTGGGNTIMLDADGNLLFTEYYATNGLRKVNFASKPEGWLWSNGATTQSITVTQAGNYTVRSTVSTCSSAISDAVSIKFATPAKPVVTASGPLTFCNGGSVTLKGPDAGDGSYKATTFAGSTVGNVNGQGTAAQLNHPNMMYQCRTGEIFIKALGTTQDAINKMDASANVSSFGSSYNLAGFGQDINNDFVVIARTFGLVFQRYNVQTGAIKSTSGFSYGYADGPLSNSKFGQNATFQFDATGRFIYVNDFYDNNVVRVIDLQTQLVSTLFSTNVGSGSGVRIIAPFGNGIYTSTGAASNLSFYHDGISDAITLTGDAMYSIQYIYPLSNGSVVITSSIVQKSWLLTPTSTNTMNAKLVYSGYLAGLIEWSNGTWLTSDGYSKINVLSPSSGDFSKYQWSTGETTQSITVTAATAGAGITLQTQTSSGCTSPASDPVVVNVTTPPVATLAVTAGNATFCSGATVTLTATGGSSYIWSDSNTVTSATRTIKTGFSTGTAYTVRAVSGSCTSVASSPVTVTMVPALSKPVISNTGLSLCAGNTTTLTATGGNGTGYLWSTGQTTASITVSGGVNYTVKAVNGSCQSAASDPVSLVVNPLPVASISASGPTTFCNGTGSVTLTASGGSAYLWSNGSTAGSITVNAVTVGSTAYTVQSIANGCTSAASSAVTVSVAATPASPTITASGATTFCSGAGSVTLTASGGNGNYVWSNGATGSSITVNSGSAAGTVYTAQSSAIGCLSAASNGITVTVNPPPSVPGITASGSTTLCQGKSVTLTASGGTGSYVWSTGATTASITVNTGTATGTNYTVRSTNAICTSAASVPVNVKVNVCANTWIGAVSTDWSTAGNWSLNVVPTLNDDAVIDPSPRNPIISGTAANVQNLIISSGAPVTNNGTLNVAGNLTNNGGYQGTGTLALKGTTAQAIGGSSSTFNVTTLILNNASGASLAVGVNIISAVNLVKGQLASNGNLTLVSNASGTGLIDDFSTGNTGTVSGTVKAERYFPLSGMHLVAAPVTGSTLAAVGLPCANIRFWSEALNAGVVATTGCETTVFDLNTPLAVTQNSGNKYTLSGTANSGDYTYNLVRGPGSSPQRGFNYVANPYPSPISWTAVAATSGLTANSNGTAYIWNPTTSNWGLVGSNGVVTGTANDLIQSGQGICVRRSTLGMTGASMTFKNSHRVNTNAAYFIRKPSTDQTLRLVLKSENSEDDILLYTSPDASVASDHLDAEKLHSHFPVAAISSGNDLAINALPTDFNGTVALNISAPKAGVYGLSVKELGDVNVTLEDRKTGTFTALNPETKLDLNLSENNEGRFALHYGFGSLSRQTQIFAADKLVTVILPEADNAVIEAVNTIGQVIGTINSTQKVTRFTLPHDGVYVIRVKSGNGVTSAKVFYE